MERKRANNLPTIEAERKSLLVVGNTEQLTSLVKALCSLERKLHYYHCSKLMQQVQAWPLARRAKETDERGALLRCALWGTRLKTVLGSGSGQRSYS